MRHVRAHEPSATTETVLDAGRIAAELFVERDVDEEELASKTPTLAAEARRGTAHKSVAYCRADSKRPVMQSVKVDKKTLPGFDCIINKYWETTKRNWWLDMKRKSSGKLGGRHKSRLASCNRHLLPSWSSVFPSGRVKGLNGRRPFSEDTNAFPTQ